MTDVIRVTVPVRSTAVGSGRARRLRAKEALDRYKLGYTVQEIAAERHMNPTTVYKYIRLMTATAGAHEKVKADHRAARRALVTNALSQKTLPQPVITPQTGKRDFGASDFRNLLKTTAQNRQND